jgi:hypothetical protein
MPIYFVQEAGRGCAVYRASDEAEDRYLCGVDLTAYHNEPQVRERFAALVEAVAAHCRRVLVAGTDKPASRLAGWPCETCESAAADDLRHLAGQLASAGEIPLSPGGLPLQCCRVQAVAGMSGRPITSQPGPRF